MGDPTGKYSITMPRDIAEAAKARSGPSGPSAYVAEAEHGPVTDEEIQALRDQLHEARRQQALGGASAA
ncbi:CopG family transcriptional regulator [Streptomyces scabiei]|uniref:CopG family transcriptional regulator n=1 Tax=Streptomyces scabiei TaxID=1930 RepID=UPI00369E82F0